jgi:NADPH2 dehydrogenase
MPSPLFSPFSLREVTLSNRIVVSPMCQYSAVDGCATDWHMLHLGTLSVSGAGLVMIEATAVAREGRITPGCLGLYSNEAEAALAPVVAACRRYGKGALGIQLNHAGRKASAHTPWRGGGPLSAAEGAWPTLAPSALPFGESWPEPMALSAAALEGVVEDFAAAARRADRLGLDVVEMHSAHGYLLHQFLSPLANRRTDEYAGSLENRLRFPLRVARAVRAVWPEGKPMGARITGTDWLDGGFGLDEAVVYARELKALGCDYVCVSGGGVVPKAPIPIGPGYMTELAGRVRRDAGIPTRAVGLIVTPRQAEAVVAEGQADMVAMARAILDDPRWVWHAGEVLGASVTYPPQYERAGAGLWPGARLARPVSSSQQ